MKLAFVFAGLVLNLSGQVFSAAGGYSGGGGDYHQMGYGTAWYIGTKEIQYCIQKDSNFGFSTAELQKNFESAAQTWKKYILNRKIQTQLPLENRLNLNFLYVGDCKGSEDLRLYFGVETNEVIKSKKKFEKPYAFAIRESYDLAAGMGKGFIWFAAPGSVFPKAGDTGFPNWTKPYTLHGMMLHELGHVLGVGHIEGTIMRESMMSWMQMMDINEPWAQSRGHAALTNVDDMKILFFHTDSEFDIAGRFTYNKESKQTKETFRTFMGRDPVGDVKVNFQHGEKMRLTIEDAQEKMTFDISAPLALRKEFSLLDNIFGVYYKAVVSVSSRGLSGIGFLTAKDGHNYTLQYNINAEGLAGPVHLSLIDGSQSKEIFFSNNNGWIL